MGSSRVELFESIRPHARREHLSIRARLDRDLARGLGRRRPTRGPHGGAVHPVAQRQGPRLGPAKPLVDAMLRKDHRVFASPQARGVASLRLGSALEIPAAEADKASDDESRGETDKPQQGRGGHRSTGELGDLVER